MAEAAPAFLAPSRVMKALEGADSAVEDFVRPAMEVEDPASSSNDFFDMLNKSTALGEKTHPHVTPEGDLMGLPENHANTYLSTGSAGLDFFFNVVLSTPEDRFLIMLENAWKENPLQALKLVFHLRGVRGTGKSDKERFYYAAVWMQKHHPATLVENLESIGEFGYFKDLLEVVLRLVEGPEEKNRKAEAKSARKAVAEVRKKNYEEWKKNKELKKVFESNLGDDATGPKKMKLLYQTSTGGYYKRKGSKARAAKMAGTLKPKEQRIAASLESDRGEKEKASATRKERKFDMSLQVAKMYFKDSKFRALYLRVAKALADRLTADVKDLQDGRVFDIGLAGKWAPSLDSSYDRNTLLCYAIATQMFPKEASPEYHNLDDQSYGLAVRNKLRKEVLVPLRRALELPEVYMSAQKWGEVNYKRVASVAMKNYKKHFLAHDEERFNKLIEDVKVGKEKIAAGALFPHEIMQEALVKTDQEAEVLELQWKQMVADLKAKGSLSNFLAIRDVSGSMRGESMLVCNALEILLSDLSEEPWKGHVITFSRHPEIHVIAGNSLKGKHDITKYMNCNMNTNFQRMFDMILVIAQRINLPPEKMVKCLVVFSDMEFDRASATSWEKDYQAICRKFDEAGYGLPPQIVFWNLRDSSSIPVKMAQNGVALVSGFSKNLLKIFLDDEGGFEPLAIMLKAISGAEYSKLRVVD